jgi:hypothetical protein
MSMIRPLLLAATVLAAPFAQAQEVTPDAAALRAHVRFLASDSLRGREPGTPEFGVAAEYVAARMEAAGLVPAGDKGGWFQKVPLISWKASEKATATLTRDGAVTSLDFGTDFISTGSYLPESSVRGEVVFVGYGITDPASGIDDYKGLDVTGKVVAFLYGAPATLPSEVRAHLSDSDTKLDTAHAHGAIAVLTIASAAMEHVYPFAQAAERWDRVRMASLDAQGDPELPGNRIPGLALFSKAGGAKLFASSRISADAVFRADAAGKPLPHGPLGVTIERVVRSKIATISSSNVVGMLPGSDPALKGETVVLSAHLDHIGIGKADAAGDTINNGAIDNAIGTASMLEVARSFQQSGAKPKRTLVFAAVTAEEKGLIGSDYLARHPLGGGRVVANLNLDMPILTYRFEDLVVYGANRTSIGPSVAAVAKAEGVVLTPDPAPEEANFVRSDHYSFVRAGVPAISLEPGPKGPGKAAIGAFLDKHYHQPSDQIDQQPTIQWDQGVRFVRINYAIARSIADAPNAPTWNKGDYFGTLFKGPMAQ